MVHFHQQKVIISFLLFREEKICILAMLHQSFMFKNVQTKTGYFHLDQQHKIISIAQHRIYHNFPYSPFVQSPKVHGLSLDTQHYTLQLFLVTTCNNAEQKKVTPMPIIKHDLVFLYIIPRSLCCFQMIMTQDISNSLNFVV